MNRPRNMNGQAGFSLFELLVVLCILAILCGFALTRLNVKQTTSSAWGIVNESAFQAAKGALTKALAQDPDNPPTLAELRNRIDSKREVYATNCSTAETSLSPPAASAGICLAIDIDGDGQSDPGEVFAAAYTDGECETEVGNVSETVCCLERPFFDTSLTNPLPFVSGPGQSF